MATARLVRTAPSSHHARIQPIATVQHVRTHIPARSTTNVIPGFRQNLALFPFSSFHTSSHLRQESKPEQKSAEEQQTTQQQQQPQQPQQETQQKPAEDQAKALIDDLKKQLGDMKSSLAYAVADLDNYKKISRRDIENATTYGITSFAKDLLDVADNLTRCLNNVPKEQIEKNEAVKLLYEGVDMTNKGLLKAFEKHGLVKFDPLGAKFDPNKMNALMHFPDTKKTPGTVGITMKVGYLLKDRCIRAADVGVVAAPPPPPEPQETEQQQQQQSQQQEEGKTEQK